MLNRWLTWKITAQKREREAMTVSEKKMIEEMQKKLERLAREINDLKKSRHDGFEHLETDDFLTQAYN